jgi:light-regulated signal transduction histidine kinase (bacteriophytochrome)
MLNHRLLENISSLESANKDLERFAFMASHDLQEPLRKIRMFGDRLFNKYNKISEEDTWSITRIQKAAERMQTLIIDILSFSKVSTDKSDFSDVDLNILMKEILNDMNEEIKESNISVSVENMPTLYVNPNLISTVFQNLIGNAVKYRRKDIETKIKVRHEISLGINGGVQNLKNRYCRIFVEDNGIGFDSKYSEEIFGMFRRLHNHDEYHGTGIGLALCKKIAELHNGYISARSKLGKGSTFIFSIPLVDEKN